MKKYLIFVFPLLLLLAYCHKPPEPEPNPEPDLPAATQEGKGTIGCYINGKPWVPKPYIAIAIPQFMEVVFDENRNSFFGMQVQKDGSLQESLSVFAYGAKIGNNLIVPHNGAAFFDSSDKNKCKGSNYFLDTTTNRLLIITKLDTEKRIISGTFEFTAISDKCKDTLKFTKGRFDANF